MAKGMVESLFEKYRLALGLALLIGILISVATEYERSGRAAGSYPGAPSNPA